MPERWVQEVALPAMTVNEAHLLLGMTMLPGERLVDVTPDSKKTGPIVRHGFRAVIQGDPIVLRRPERDIMPDYLGMSS